MLYLLWIKTTTEQLILGHDQVFCHIQFLLREFLDSVALSRCLNVSPGWYPIGFVLSFFVCFVVVVVCFAFFELAFWLFVSLSLWVLIENKK